MTQSYDELVEFLENQGTGLRQEPVEVAFEALTSQALRDIARNVTLGVQLTALREAQERDTGPSGFWGRAKAVGSGFVDIVASPFLVGHDLGSGESLGSSLRNRSADILSAGFGPNGLIGGPINLIPEQVRSPVRHGVVDPFIALSDLLYRNVADRPLSTLIVADELAANQAGRNPLARIGAYFDGSTWRDARTIVVENDLSIGESLALLFDRDVDYYSPQEIQDALNSDNLAVAALGLDIAANMLLDPLDKLGMAARVGRARRVRILDQADIERTIARPSTQRMLDAMGDMSAPEIASRYFPRSPAASDLSVLLEAATDRETRELVLRAGMRDTNALNRLLSDQPLLADMFDSAMDTGTAETVLMRRALDEGDDLALVLQTSRERALTYEASIRHIYDDATPEFVASATNFVEGQVRAGVAERLALRIAGDAYGSHPGVFGGIQDSSAFGSPATALRHTITSSRWYQTNRLATPLRYVVERQPQRLINLSDTSGAEQVRRITMHGRVDPDIATDLQTRYAAALDPEARAVVAAEAMDEAISSIASRKGVDRATIEDLLVDAADQRARTRLAVENSIMFDEDGRAWATLTENGVSTRMQLPLFETESPNFLPTFNVSEFERAASRIGRFQIRHPGAAVPGMLLEQANSAWKVAALLRLGWPIRVLSDEQMRRMARLQVLADTTGQPVSGWRIPARGERLVVSPSGQRLNFPDPLADSWDELVSSDALLRRFYRGQEAEAMAAMQSHSQRWIRMDPDVIKPVEYDPAWERFANEQVGRSAVGRQILEGRSDAAIVDWLKNSADGRQIVSRMRILGGDDWTISGWVETARDQINAYIPSRELQISALDGSARASRLREMVAAGDVAAMPFIHGGVLDNVFGGPVQAMFNRVTETLVRSLGSRPTDILSRNPTFRAFYDAEIGRQVGLMDAGHFVDEGEINRIATQARRYALHETKSLLYDLQETSQFAESLRFMSPFYNAFEEVATRWIGLAYQNPAVIGKLGIAGRAIEALTEVNDDGEREFVFRLPKGLADFIPGLNVNPELRFNVERLPILQDLMYNTGPGAGPIVTIPVNEVVKHRPELADSVEFILPFGANADGIIWQAMPTVPRNLWTIGDGYFHPDDNDRYAATAYRIFRDRVTDWQLANGSTEWKPLSNELRKTLWEDAMRDARDFWSLRTVASFVLPAQPQWMSPYQTFIDAYQDARDAWIESPLGFATEYGYDTPDDWFIAKYGSAYFGLTASLRANPEGLAPTLEAEMVREKYDDLLTRYPEVSGAIAGSEDEGEFNRAVYQSRFGLRDVDEFQNSPEVQLGWREFIALTDVIDEELDRRIGQGLPATMRADGPNADLAAIKARGLENLYETYPAWRRAYEQPDFGTMRLRHEAFRDLANDDRLRSRPDWVGVRDYYRGRDLIVAELGRRDERPSDGSAVTLESQPDLEAMWEAVVTDIRLQNPTFAAFWARWLERDELRSDDPTGGG